MKCVSTVSYSVVFNGKLGEVFHPSRGDEADRLQNHENNENIRLVSDLIEATTRTWKTDVIMNTFSIDVVRKIMQIPLVEIAYEDLQIWRGELSAYDQQHSRSVSGLLARNEKGDILASKMVTHFEIVTPFMAEAQAELQTVKLGIFMGLNKMDVKGDSKTFIKKCQSSKIDKSTIGATIRDIQSTKDRFQEMGFHFIPKTMNIYAHVIVKEALKRRESCYLVGGILEHVSQAMEKYRPRHSD
ncbi:hypothetical protein PVK06_019464 [Gossypium arboreum]|uniref:RNase H type-1 domain-containing protein n=1 Tax=Gossypium arboreum TaxID=29729 RepID=A0ABR0PK48_GOSAR|nr:hypothetical protein PVK06_019464 [Gossypium arboreum]